MKIHTIIFALFISLILLVSGYDKVNQEEPFQDKIYIDCNIKRLS